MVTKTAALELGPKQIRVNSINPGPVMTSIGRAMGVAQEQFDKMFEQLKPKMLMQRVGVPDDIANLASFLASDDARNITGSIFVSDSGALLKMNFINREEIMQEIKANK
jgi:NAD(P)-dependent dehydrogenase (short-subunit alcohol dehydrogenase family)